MCFFHVKLRSAVPALYNASMSSLTRSLQPVMPGWNEDETLLDTLPETNIAIFIILPLTIGFLPCKGNVHLPSINFQGRAGRFREGYFKCIKHIMKILQLWGWFYTFCPSNRNFSEPHADNPFQDFPSLPTQNIYCSTFFRETSKNRSPWPDLMSCRWENLHRQESLPLLKTKVVLGGSNGAIGSPIAQPDWERCLLLFRGVDQRNCINQSCLSDLPFSLMVSLFGSLGKIMCFPINIWCSDPTRCQANLSYAVWRSWCKSMPYTIESGVGWQQKLLKNTMWNSNIGTAVVVVVVLVKVNSPFDTLKGVSAIGCRVQHPLSQ